MPPRTLAILGSIAAVVSCSVSAQPRTYLSDPAKPFFLTTAAGLFAVACTTRSHAVSAMRPTLRVWLVLPVAAVALFIGQLSLVSGAVVLTFFLAAILPTWFFVPASGSIRRLLIAAAVLVGLFFASHGLRFILVCARELAQGKDWSTQYPPFHAGSMPGRFMTAREGVFDGCGLLAIGMALMVLGLVGLKRANRRVENPVAEYE